MNIEAAERPENIGEENNVPSGDWRGTRSHSIAIRRSHRTMRRAATTTVCQHS